MLKENCAFHNGVPLPAATIIRAAPRVIQPRFWQQVAPRKPNHALILGIALESKIANLKSPIRIPRGVTVTQPRKLSGLFLVRIRARILPIAIRFKMAKLGLSTLYPVV